MVSISRKQQSSVTVNRSPTKEKTNFYFPCAVGANKQEFAVSFFRLQQTNGNCSFPLLPLFVCVFKWYGPFEGTAFKYKYV
jgi:hypothetical protein